LNEENVVRPEGLSVLGVEPDSVKLDLRRIPPESSAPPSEQDGGRHD
jgi:hypothetical protein